MKKDLKDLTKAEIGMLTLIENILQEMDKEDSLDYNNLLPPYFNAVWEKLEALTEENPHGQNTITTIAHNAMFEIIDTVKAELPKMLIALAEQITK